MPDGWNGNGNPPDTEKTKCVCVGTRTQEGKFTAPELAFEKLLPMADYILAEADGSKHLPLKAHAAMSR